MTAAPKGVELAPRLLTSEQVAAYLTLPLAEVARLTVGRLLIGTRLRFDRVALDEYLDARLGRVAESPPPAQNDPEAALERFRAVKANASRSS
jgi:hypothetical protein